MEVGEVTDIDVEVVTLTSDIQSLRISLQGEAEE